MDNNEISKDDLAEIEDYLKLLRHGDDIYGGADFEESYSGLLKHIHQIKDRLILELEKEKSPFIRGALIELLGDTKNKIISTISRFVIFITAAS